MPTGKLNDPNGPGAHATLGVVENSNENFEFFLNNATILEKDGPVLYGISACDIEIDSTPVKVKIATLEKGKSGQPLISENPWPDRFRAQWVKEWDAVSEERIKYMNMMKDGRVLTKKEILNMRAC